MTNKLDVTRRPGETDTAYKKRLLKIEEMLKNLSDATKYRKIDFFKPYEKQQEFFDMGAVKRERLLSAGNQLGKTEAGAAEMTYHLTGEYPEDWIGYRFDKPIKAWACGVTSLDVRDTVQTKLFGEPGLDELLGTGYVPRDKIVGKPSLARGVTDAFDTVHVRHKSGGVSTLTFKSYEQGRKKFQGRPMDLIWADEEPDEDVYNEMLARIAATQGRIYTTFTPLEGRTKLVIRFWEDKAPDRGRVNITLDDAKSLPAYDSEEKRKAVAAAYPAHQRDARARGIPMLGSGVIFSVPEEAISEPTIPLSRIPQHWFKGWAIDFGIALDHGFAAVLLCWDKDVDILHLVHCLKIVGQTALQHSVPLKQIGANLPIIWPHDGHGREKSNGEELASIYRKYGLKMCPDHATFETGGYSTEAGILEMDERFRVGKLKIARHLEPWFDEYRLYHRKDGLVVRQNDDLMSATRIGVMARRMLKPVPLGGKTIIRRPGDAQICDGAVLSDRDLWG